MSKKERDAVAFAKMSQDMAPPAANTDRKAKDAISTNNKNASLLSSSSSSIDRRGEHTPSGPRSMRNSLNAHSSNRRRGGNSGASNSSNKDISAQDADTEKKMLKERYMGIVTEERKQKRRRLGDRKFTFEWNADDDTSMDFDPIYRGEVSSSLALKNVGTEEETRRRTKELQEITRKKKSTNWDSMHWSEKPLEMMKERDWRIFKEDFSIATKGELFLFSREIVDKC